MLLKRPTQSDYLQVKSWFNSHLQIYTWGGPNMTLPMSDEDFLALLVAEHVQSRCLISEDRQLLAFGQYYPRLEHHHLGRLAVNPKYRGQGLAKTLVTQLLKQAYSDKPAKGASLFVFKDNVVAYRCYQSLGFIEMDYPDTIPGNMKNCVYMTQKN